MPKLYGIHSVQLKPGVDAQAFERFIAEEAFRTPPSSGLTLRLVKGDRGDREGEYLIIFDYDTVERRNRDFPTPGQPSAVFQQEMQAVSAAWDKLGDFTSTDSFTDYVEVARTT